MWRRRRWCATAPASVDAGKGNFAWHHARRVADTGHGREHEGHKDHEAHKDYFVIFVFFVVFVTLPSAVTVTSLINASDRR
jgi:hypothetical protein